MARYLVYGTINYSSTANRTTAMSAMNTVVNADNGVTPLAIGTFAAGITNVSNAVNIGLVCDDEATAESFRAAFLTAWTGSARSTSAASFISIVREAN